MSGSLWDDIAAEENARAEVARAEIAAERAAYDALTPEQREAITAAYEAKFPDVPEGDDEPETCDDCGETDCNGECED